MSVVTLLTTMWDKANPSDPSGNYSVFEEREKNLKAEHWGPLIQAGAQMLRSEKGKEAISSLLAKLLDHSTGAILAVQIQLVDRKLTLAQTDPGEVLMDEIGKSRQGLTANRESVEADLAKLQAEGRPDSLLRARLAELDAQIKAANEAQQRLQSWTFDAILTSLIVAGVLGVGSAGVYGTGYAIYLGAVTLAGLAPPVAIAIATLGVAGAIIGVTSYFEGVRYQ